jgi:hypothetical protein
MSRKITQAEVDEICAFCETHPNARIDSDGDGFSVVVSNDETGYYCHMHPLTFLDVIHSADVGEDILK